MPQAQPQLRSFMLQKPGRRLRQRSPEGGLTDRVREAIRLMIFEGYDRKSAAEAARLADRSLIDAFTKPAVIRHIREQEEVWNTGGRIRAVRRITHLVDHAASEKVQLEASKHLAPNSNSDRHGTTVNVNVTPGYVIDLSEPDDQPPTIEMEANVAPVLPKHGA